MLIEYVGVGFDYGETNIFQNVNLNINDKDTIGLIGENGSGKTTFLNVTTKALDNTQGEIRYKNGLRIGYLKQNSGLDSQKTVYDEMLSVFDDTLNDIRLTEEISEKLAKVDHTSIEFLRLSGELDRLNAKISAVDGYNIDVRIKTILNGMGYEGMYERTISTMSGGEKTKLALCKLLLDAPDLLILDEPTNHLDFKTLNFLENFLTSYKGAVLIVSHDRYFLDKTVKRIWDLEDNRIESYSGNYSKYLILKEEEYKTRVKEYEKQVEKVASMKEYAERNIARASTSKSAKSRLAQLSHIEPLEKPKLHTKTAHFAFNFGEESNKVVFTVDNLSMSFPDKTLFENVSFEIRKGDRVGLIGENGTGKSTLIKEIIANKNSHIRYGKDVRVGYYDQENLNLNFNNTVIDELWGRHHRESQTTIRSILAGLLLTSEDIDKPVGVLSGGERAKLGFAVLMAEDDNVLVLDEPTNHLDLKTREALEKALREYKGTILFVSHDRYFLDKIATKIYELDNKKITNYVGNFSDYNDRKKILLENEAKALEALTPIPTRSTIEQNKNSSHRSAKDRASEVKQKLRIKELEKIIADLEATIEQTNNEMLQPDILADYKKYGEYQTKINDLNEKLEQTYDEWMTLNS